MLDKKVEVDIDNDGKSDIKIDVKFLGLLIGGIISLTMTYSQLTAEIEIAKELPKQEKINILKNVRLRTMSRNADVGLTERGR